MRSLMPLEIPAFANGGASTESKSQLHSVRVFCGLHVLLRFWQATFEPQALGNTRPLPFADAGVLEPGQSEHRVGLIASPQCTSFRAEIWLGNRVERIEGLAALQVSNSGCRRQEATRNAKNRADFQAFGDAAK
jgi:hypothetical protein